MYGSESDRWPQSLLLPVVSGPEGNVNKANIAVAFLA